MPMRVNSNGRTELPSNGSTQLVSPLPMAHTHQNLLWWLPDLPTTSIMLPADQEQHGVNFQVKFNHCGH